MGKKGKGNKLAKMSEEERARYLQMRADIEEEARRRKMQLLMLYMKNKLKREEAFCRLNMAKINQEWRSILRQVKCEELRSELVELEKFTKEAMERKNQVINRLLNDLDVAEETHCTLQNAHMEMVDKFMTIQQERMNFFKQIYESEKEQVLKEFYEDFESMKKLRDDAQEQLECVMYQLEDQAEKEQEESHERHLQRVDDLKSEMELRLEEITQAGETKLQNIWQEYQDVLSGYVRHTEGFYAEYMDLKERDEENTATIREHCHEIEKATDQLAHLKLVAAETIENNEVKVKHMEKVKADLTERLKELKKQVDREIREGEEKFKLMTVESHNALKHAEDLAKKGRTILQLSAVCRKLETEREKILPLGLPPIVSKPMFENSEQDLKEVPEALKEHSFGNWKEMENFWKRVNNATIDVVYLKQQKKSLEEKNMHLKEELQEYLVRMNISNGSNMHINDYLAKRPSSMRVDHVTAIDLDKQRKKSESSDGIRPFRRLRPVTAYVEANFTNAVRSMELAKGRVKLARIETIVHD